MITTTYHCDGLCKRKMTEAEVMESAQTAQAYAADRTLSNQEARQLLTEIFCPECCGRAADFWDSKSVVLKELEKQVKARIENHRNRFWAKKLEAVKNVG